MYICTQYISNIKQYMTKINISFRTKSTKTNAKIYCYTSAYIQNKIQDLHMCTWNCKTKKKPFILQTVERGIWKNGILYISNISLRNDLVQQLVSFSGLIYLNTSNMNILTFKQLICNMKK